MQELAFLLIYVHSYQGGRWSCCRWIPCVCGAAGQQQQAGRSLPGAHPLLKLFFVHQIWRADFAQREWRMVAQALSVPRYDFAMAHIPTSRWVTWPDLTRAKSFENSSGWTQARYARSHRVQVWEVGDHLHCTNSAIDWFTLFLLWEIFLFIRRNFKMAISMTWKSSIKIFLII